MEDEVMKTTRIFTVAATFTGLALILTLNSGHSSERPKTHQKFQSTPATTAYLVTESSEIQWRPSFDVNPDAVHDLSLPRD